MELTMPKCHKRPKTVQNDLRVDGLEIVQFAEVFDRRDSPLVVLEVVFLFKLTPCLSSLSSNTNLHNSPPNQVGCFRALGLRR